MNGLGLLVASLGLFTTSLLYLRWVEDERLRRTLAAYELRFPRQVDPVAVAAFFSGVSGIVPPRLVRRLIHRPLIVEVGATAAGIRHHLLVPRSLAGVC